MIDSVLSTALSGLQAQTKSVRASASNIANYRTIGEIPSDSSTKDPYTPGDTVFSSVVGYNGEGQGVKADYVARDPAYTPVYDPDSVYANEEGLVAAPNVSLDEELININLASNIYKANIAVIKTADEMSKELLDTLA